MDSLSQIALGAAVSIAVFRKRQPLCKSALLGAIGGTLPDLDVLLAFDDPISQMTRHRAESHGLFYLTLACWPLAWLWRQFAGRHGSYQRCWWALWAVLITHPLLDYLTIYGTQLAQPFSQYAFGTGSIFVIDPLFTLPLLFGIILALARQQLRWNNSMLAVACLYLLFGLGAQQHVRQQLANAVPADADASTLLVTATPFNTLVWQALVLSPTHYYEGFYALADGNSQVQWRAWPRDAALLAQYQQAAMVRQLTEFSHNYVVLSQAGDQLLLADLRMGLAPYYSFRFVFDRQADGQLGPPIQLPMARQPGQIAEVVRWLAQRAQGNSQQAFFNPTADTQTALLPPSQAQAGATTSAEH